MPDISSRRCSIPPGPPTTPFLPFPLEPPRLSQSQAPCCAPMRASTRPRNFRPILEFSRSQYLSLSSFCAPNFSKFSIPTIRNLLNYREGASSFHRLDTLLLLYSSSLGNLANFRGCSLLRSEVIFISLNASKNIDFKGNTSSRITRMKRWTKSWQNCSRSVEEAQYLPGRGPLVPPSSSQPPGRSLSVSAARSPSPPPSGTC